LGGIVYGVLNYCGFEPSHKMMGLNLVSGLVGLQGDCGRVLYRNSNLNLTIGCLTRLLGLPKDPKSSNYQCVTVEENNDRCDRQQRAIRKYRHHFFNLFSGEYIDIEPLDYVRDHYADAHPKKALRIKSFEALLAKELDFFDMSLWSCDHVLIKLKLNEYAKKGKFPRVISDLSGSLKYGQNVLSSMVGMGVVDALKHIMEKPIIFVKYGKRCIILFIPGPRMTVLSGAFDLLINGIYEGEYYSYRFIYFSDDSCVAYDTNDGVVMANVDISSCDASHSRGIFTLAQQLGDLTGQGRIMKLLIKQLCCDIHIPISVDEKGRRVTSHTIVYGLNTPRLASGSVLTTFINNLASALIGISCGYDYCKGSDEPISTGSYFAGYYVTSELAQCPEDLQFLKHSPMMCEVSGDIKYYPVMNLGPFFRQDGCHIGTYPTVKGKKMSVDALAVAHRISVFRGLYPYCKFGCSMDSLHTNNIVHNKNVDYDDTTVVVVDHDSLFKRYTAMTDETLSELLTPGVVYELESDLGQVWSCVMAKDYGY